MPDAAVAEPASSTSSDAALSESIPASSSPAEQPVSDTGVGGDYDFTDPGADLLSLTPSDAKQATPLESETGKTAPATPEVAAATPPIEPAATTATTTTTPSVVPTAVPPVAPAQPEYTQNQIQRAAALGWAPEQLSAFRDPEVGLLQAENLALKAMAFAQQQTPQIQQQQPAQAPVQPPQPPPAFDEAAVRKGLEGYDDNIVNISVQNAKQIHAAHVQNYNLERQNFENRQWMQQAYNAIKQNEKAVVETQQSYQQREQMQLQAQQTELINRDFSDFLNGLDPAIKGVVGKDENGQIKQQILANANFTLQGMMASGMQNLPENKVLFEQAMYATLGSKISSISREQVRADVKTHQDRSIAKPSGAKPTLPPGDERAADFVESWYKARGLVGSDIHSNSDL